MSDERTRPIPSTSTVRQRQVTLTVVSGPDKNRSAALKDGPIIVGTDPSCSLPLTDDTVSKRHCELVGDGGTLVLRDLDSTNGVLVEGVRVRVAFPDSKARIRVGRTTLLVKVGPEEEVAVSTEDRYGPLFGRSAVMRAVFAPLDAIAQSSAPVLIEGETGTGKDITAEALHRASPRAEGPLVVFDCAAVSSTLLEAELFGYEKGAFTGASDAREGLAESADEGTLVIDEVGELPLELQPKLLRLIEKKEVRRIGANAVHTVDVRIIACTNRALRAEVKSGRFREDLFFRLSALRVRLPALRERIEDIPPLVDAMLGDRGSKLRFADLPESAQAMLFSHSWPGNVRELRNTVERLVVFPPQSTQGLIDPDESPQASSPARVETWLPLTEARTRASEAFERRYLTDLLQRSGGSISESARLAGVSRQFLQRILRKHAMR